MPNADVESRTHYFVRLDRNFVPCLSKNVSFSLRKCKSPCRIGSSYIFHHQSKRPPFSIFCLQSDIYSYAPRTPHSSDVAVNYFCISTCIQTKFFFRLRRQECLCE